jgi:hypothetical protein
MLDNKAWKRRRINYISFITNGIYKVVKYGKFWFAYFKPVGWKCWGQSCEHEFGKSKAYSTMKDAIKACEKHSLNY